MTVSRPDILILGAGVLGSAAAWHLARKEAGEILVLDLDLAGTFSSSELNAGGCRATWWQPVNVEFSWHSLKFYETIAGEIQFFQQGYLFLYLRDKWETALQKKSLYESFKIPIRYLRPEEIRPLLPEFENLKGVAGATYSPKDGLLDPHLLREFYRREAKALGVHFLDGCYVQSMTVSKNRIQSVEILHRENSPIREDQVQEILCSHQISDPQSWTRESFQPQAVLNCTGAWLPITSKFYQRSLPIRPIRRQISLFSTHEEDFTGRGMIVDTSGLYFHPEGKKTGLILAGYSNRDEKPGYDFDYDGEPFFDRKIWLRLYRRGGGNHFGALKHVRGWAGLYAVGPDNTGLLWQVEGFENLFELGAATGRGVMQSYALGLAMAELMVHHRFETLDGSPLSPKRFQTGALLPERLDI